jgi:hypothetical protein
MCWTEQALPVTSDEKRALSVARRRKGWWRPFRQAEWAISSRRADQGRDGEQRKFSALLKMLRTGLT